MPTVEDRTEQVYAAIAAEGFYPAIAISQLRPVVGAEPILAGVASTDLRMGDENDMQMQLMTLLITPTRLVAWGGFEQATDGQKTMLHTQARTIPLTEIAEARLQTQIEDPISYTDTDTPDVAQLIIQLKAMDSLELLPMACDDEDCENTHGFASDIEHDVVVISHSKEVVGAAGVDQLIDLAAVLNRALAR